MKRMFVAISSCFVTLAFVVLVSLLKGVEFLVCFAKVEKSKNKTKKRRVFIFELMNSSHKFVFCLFFSFFLKQ